MISLNSSQKSKQTEPFSKTDPLSYNIVILPLFSFSWLWKYIYSLCYWLRRTSL